MAVRGQDFKIDFSSRDNLMKNDISNALKIAPAETIPVNFIGPTQTIVGSIGGITAEMQVNVNQAIDNYKNKIQKIIDKLVSVGSNVAFKGENINKSIENFVGSVRDTSNEYIEVLNQTQTEIVKAVQRSYQAKDMSESTEIGQDSKNISEAKPSYKKGN